MTTGPALVLQTIPDGETHLVVMLLLLPFVLVFMRAAWLEFRRWYLYGPAENNRARFAIDESAPSYDLPPLPVRNAPSVARRLPRA